MRKSTPAKRLLSSIAAPLLLVLLIALALFIYTTFHKPPEVDITATGFVPSTIQITEGETIHFVNQSSSVIQNLCLGQSKVCDTHAADPVALKSPGLQIAPGQAKDVVFAAPGTFKVTSTTRPDMNLTITVNAAG